MVSGQWPVISCNSWSTQIKMEQLLLHKGPLVHINHSHRTATFSRKPFYTATHPEQQPPLQQLDLKQQQQQQQKAEEMSAKAIFNAVLWHVYEEYKTKTTADALLQMSQKKAQSAFVINAPNVVDQIFQNGVEAYISKGKQQADTDIKRLYEWMNPESDFPTQNNWKTKHFFDMTRSGQRRNINEIAAVVYRGFMRAMVNAGETPSK